MANKRIKIKKMRSNSHLPESKNGNWHDLYTSGVSVLPSYTLLYQFNIPKQPENVEGVIKYNTGDIVILYLGIATDLGKGYEANLLPRSSTFKNTGLILTNSMGLIDDSYNGDEDEWLAVCYATRRGQIKIGDRHMQFTIKKTGIFDLEEVETLGNPSRGGYGSTGK